jgi:hypothetical protein
LDFIWYDNCFFLNLLYSESSVDEQITAGELNGRGAKFKLVKSH